jgi:Rod binding domain-containing protein
MPVVPASGTTTPTADAAKSKKDTPEAIAKAATDFEALLIGQLLQAARAGGSGWLDTNSEDANSSLTDMSEQVLSKSLATSGGLGLAKMVKAGLAKTVESNTKSDGVQK